MKIAVVINFEFEGIHCWPACTLTQVMFLQHAHRHIFHVRCEKEVSHCDRDEEIILLKRSAQAYIAERFPNRDLGSLSCEMIAEELLKKFNLSSCEVLEDGENGARVVL